MTSEQTPGRGSAPRQTLSYLRNLFEERGIQPKDKLGQNFLIDLNLLDLIVRLGVVSREDVVLEVGTGTGSLTTRLADRAGFVVTVEVDPGFADLARDTLSGRPNVQLIQADALAGKNTLNPEVLAALDEARARIGAKHVKLIANLPYSVATPVIANLLLSDQPIERMVVMVQWEIALRLDAYPGQPNYGALAVLTRSLANVRLVRRISPKVFWPRPEVDSAIVAIYPKADKRAHVGDVHAFRTFLRDLYVHRRKNLRGALAGMAGRKWDKAEVDRRLAGLGLDGTRRAEDLDLEQHLRLAAAFRE
jgi:16S rRNA (adenine1518-N6/adenine1519-N6)-dimethyltransferase